MKDLIKKNRYYFLTILLFLVAGAIFLLIHSKSTVSLWVNHHYSSFFDYFFLLFNAIGDIYFSLITVFFLLLLKDWKWALKATWCFIATALVTQFMKHILFPDSVRPVLYFEEGALRLLEDVVQLTTNSFPSGHTSAAFSVATFLALLKSGRNWNFVFAFIALFVGYGRIYMSQHFITDVYMGMIVGVVITLITWRYYPKSLEPK